MLKVLIHRQFVFDFIANKWHFVFDLVAFWKVVIK